MATRTRTRNSNKNSNKNNNMALTTPVVLYAFLLFRALRGDFGPQITQFYYSAIKNHTRKGTQFPRSYTDSRGNPIKIELLSIPEAEAFLRKPIDGKARAGMHISQRLFDQMMVETAKAKAAGIKFK